MMENERSWSLGGGPGTACYAFYDRLRHGVSHDLVGYFRDAGIPLTRVLEAGSGPGFTTSLLSASTGVKTGIAMDFDPQSLDEGRKSDPSLKAVAGDLYCLPFADGSFDLVWNSSTLEHLERMDDGLREMARICKAGGHVFVGVPYCRGPLCFQPLVGKTSLGIWLGPVFSTRGMEERFRRVGLEPCGTHHYFFRFFVGILARKPAAGL